MIALRFLLIAFNVAVIGFLIYEMVTVVQKPIERSRKTLFLIGGTMLLLAPLGMFFRFFSPSPQYFLVYPVAIYVPVFDKESVRRLRQTETVIQIEALDWRGGRRICS